jgi:hypothetical protein
VCDGESGEVKKTTIGRAEKATAEVESHCEVLFFSENTQNHKFHKFLKQRKQENQKSLLILPKKQDGKNGKSGLSADDLHQR